MDILLYFWNFKNRSSLTKTQTVFEIRIKDFISSAYQRDPCTF